MSTHRVANPEKQLAIIVGLALLAATYTVFSVRTLLDSSTPGDILSLKRFLTTAAGAGLFVLVVKQAPQRIAQLLFLTLGAAASILALRIGYDLLVAHETGALLGPNLRWLITWLGYFVAALGCYFTLVSARRAMRASKSSAAPTRSEMAQCVVAEVRGWAPAERTALIAVITKATHYEEADPLIR